MNGDCKEEIALTRVDMAFRLSVFVMIFFFPLLSVSSVTLPPTSDETDFAFFLPHANGPPLHPAIFVSRRGYQALNAEICHGKGITTSVVMWKKICHAREALKIGIIMMLGSGKA